MSLAIIIPAYKIDFFEFALQSLVNQTNKNFILYIGDDNSPFNILEIVKKYENLIDIKYHRFEQNLGKLDLVGQWNRCVALIGNEDWIWLFSDDDVADSNCVETFYNNLQKTEAYYDVYRFNTIVIDGNNNVTSASPVSPFFENSEDLALNILLSKRGNSMPDHIFRKSKYDELNGFVNFAFGQSADWATSILFSYPKGIISMSEANVKWRYSTINLSSNASNQKNKMLFGFLDFITWINETYLNLVSQIEKKNEIQNASFINLNSVIDYHYKGITLSSYHKLIKILIKYFDFNLINALKYCLLQTLKRSSLNRLRRFIFRLLKR